MDYSSSRTVVVANVAMGALGNSATIEPVEQIFCQFNSLRDTRVAKDGPATRVFVAAKWLVSLGYQLPLPLRRENPLGREGYSPCLTATVARSKNDKCSHGGREPSSIATQRRAHAARRRALGCEKALAEDDRMPRTCAHPVADVLVLARQERAAPALGFQSRASPTRIPPWSS